MNMENRGYYETELNKMLKMNDLPETKAPANPPSLKIFTKAREAENQRNYGKKRKSKVNLKHKLTKKMKETKYKQQTEEIRKDKKQRKNNSTKGN